MIEFLAIVALALSGQAVWQSILSFLIYLALIVVPWALIWKRTGHSWKWALYLLLPVTNIFVAYLVAFKSWPIEEGRRHDGE